MTRTITLISLSLAAALLAQPTTSAAAGRPKNDDREPTVADRGPDLAAGIIVRTRSDARLASLRGMVADVAGADVRTTSVARGISALQTVSLMRLSEAEALAARVAERPGVVWAEANALVRPDDEGDVAAPTPVNDPLYGNLANVWDVRDATHPEVAAVAPSAWPAGGYSTKAPALWRSTRGSGSVVLAVVDTGVRPHQDLAPSLLPGYDLIESPAISNDGDGRDADAGDPGDWVVANECYGGSPARDSSWHGTHVAGTAAAPADNALGVAGVAPGVRILPVRVLGTCGGTIADIATGVVWASGATVAGLPANPTPADVINLSLGGEGVCDATYQSAIDIARAQGATVVVSAGNDNSDASLKRPANCTGVVTVGSTSEYGDKASYSNYGPVVDVSAPGGDSFWDGRGILSTYNAGTTTPGADTYDELQGTSMAAPAVSGAAALLASLGSFTPDQMEAALKAAVIPFPTSADGDWLQCLPGLCGTGVLDLAVVPAPVTPPTVVGRLQAGRTVTAAPGTWTGPAVPLAFTWFLDGRVVATGPSYRIVEKGALTLRVGPTAGEFTPILRDSAAVVPRGKRSRIALDAPKRVRKGIRPHVTIEVKVKGTKRPTGRIAIFDGAKKLKKVKLTKGSKGEVTLRLRAVADTLGTHELTARFTGKVGVWGSVSNVVTVTVVRR